MNEDGLHAVTLAKEEASPTEYATLDDSMSGQQLRARPFSKRPISGQAAFLPCPQAPYLLISGDKPLDFPSPRVHLSLRKTVKSLQSISAFRSILMVSAILAFASSSSYAHSYGFLNQAIREHTQNPSPETQARLTTAQYKARLLDFGIISIPAGLIGYILVRCFTHKKKSESADESL